MNAVALVFELNLLWNYGPFQDKKLGVISRPSIGYIQLIILVSIRREIEPKKTNMTAQYIFSQNVRLATASKNKRVRRRGGSLKYETWMISDMFIQQSGKRDCPEIKH
jgi:hypothetical protein